MFTPPTATDDPARVVTVAASDGKSGNERSISYTNCKVVGNGSFGVVFAAKMLSEKQADGTTTEEEEIAIKKVLQDKRFKVCSIFIYFSHLAYRRDSWACMRHFAVPHRHGEVPL